MSGLFPLLSLSYPPSSSIGRILTWDRERRGETKRRKGKDDHSPLSHLRSLPSGHLPQPSLRSVLMAANKGMEAHSGHTHRSLPSVVTVHFLTVHSSPRSLTRCHVTHPLAFTLWSFPISSFLRINKIQIEKREDTKCSYSCLQSVFMRMLYGWVGSSLIPTSWPNKPTILSIPAAGKRLSANVDVRENEERGRNCWLFLRLLSSSFHFFSVSWTQVMDRREKIHSLPSLYVVIPLSLPDLSFIPVLVTLLPCL